MAHILRLFRSTVIRTIQSLRASRRIRTRIHILRMRLTRAQGRVGRTGSIIVVGVETGIAVLSADSKKRRLQFTLFSSATFPTRSPTMSFRNTRRGTACRQIYTQSSKEE